MRIVFDGKAAAPVLTEAPSTLAEPAAENKSAAAADAFEAVSSAADVKARYGTTKSALPALLDDWRKAVVEASIEELGMAKISPRLDAALQQAEAQAGRPLDDDEQDQVVDPLINQLLPGAMQQVAPMLDGDPSKRQRTIQDALSRHGGRIARKRDPFTPVAQGDPAARARETVLWENPHVMVLADRFARSPKALVVPKKPMSFPTDASPAALKELARVAAAVSDAFGQATKSGPAEIWINPPQHLSVRQLHVHVQPGLPRWDTRKAPEKLARQQALFWAQLGTTLAQRLGPAQR